MLGEYTADAVKGTEDNTGVAVAPIAFVTRLTE
jgi:hypothetical protein